jgi:protein-tyrosine phosphatase
MRERALAWEGCLNVRDLGGHPTEDGGETLWDRVIRADSVHSLTDQGWEALAADGVATIVDLRSHGERADDPPRDLDLDVVHVPLLAEEGDPVYRKIDAVAKTAVEGAHATRLFYLEVLRRWNTRFAEAISAVAAAQPGAVVVHCAVGKDRTGLISALLLRVAGVSIRDIADDYALSSPNLEPRWRPWVDEAADEPQREHRLRMVASPARSMLGVIDALEAEHGSIAEYLRSAGLDATTVASARARLRG